MNAGIDHLQLYRKVAAKEIVNSGGVNQNVDGTFNVKSQSENKFYKVEIVGGKYYYCPCKDYESRSKFLMCKHELAAELYMFRKANVYITH